MNGSDLILRQTFSGKSQLCSIDQNGHTIYVPVLPSTFNQPFSNYTIVVDDNLVVSKPLNEPLKGITREYWIVSTGEVGNNMYAGM